jgi:hypothetical protein
MRERGDMDEYIKGNQQLWDEYADINYQSGMYDVASFKIAPDPLEPLILTSVGDVTGKSLLHSNICTSRGRRSRFSWRMTRVTGGSRRSIPHCR